MIANFETYVIALLVIIVFLSGVNLILMDGGHHKK